ncbi:hepatocyte growth factor receptor-like [Uloborus diversus]|uniref:hepatocyte growth factor receptor-like n=1 Tax=Uloborus diversus TaxID=327109 RepID=UPI002409505E|nr:hepatocyte growth factor receptor-like [Uloborus diversus]
MFITLPLFLLLFGLVGSSFVQFRDPHHPEPLLNVLVRPCSPAPCEGGDVYVGGQDTLFHLDLGLGLRARVSTGPALDSPECPPPPAPCPDVNRTVVHDRNRILLLTPEGRMLLSCGTLYQGMCRLHKADGIASSILVGSPNETVNFVSGRGSTVAFWGSVGNGSALYAASTYDDRPLQWSPASVSKRLLLREKGGYAFRYAHRTDKEFSGVNFEQPYKKSYKVDYISGFTHGDYAYFLTTQPVSGESTAYETRLARVCQRDPKFFSYTEVPLACRLGGQPYLYNLASSAHLGVASAALRNRLKLGRSGEAVLFVAFVSALPEHGRTVDERRGSVICSFPLAAVETAFANATRDCSKGEPRTFLLKHVVGDDIPCIAREAEEGLCGSEFNHFVSGREPLPGGFRMHLEDHVTAVFTAIQNTHSVLFAGTSEGQLVKVHLDRTRQSNLFRRTIAEGVAVQPSHAYDNRSGNVYFLAGDAVVRFPVSSCSAYESCELCLTVEDPLKCGWCGDRCAHRDECPTPDLLSHEKCPPIIRKVSPPRGPLEGGTLVRIEGDNFGSPALGEDVSKMEVSVAGHPCHIYSWDKEKVECRTSPVSEPTSGQVVLNVSDRTWIKGHFNMEGVARSGDTFHYVSPRLWGVSPGRGPVSGGTTLTLVGEELDIGSSHQVNVSGVPCEILQLRPGRALCLTGPLNGSSGAPGPVEMRIDDAVVEVEASGRPDLHKAFRYLPDPEIRDIKRQVTTISGSRNLTVLGSHLDSVAQPRMVVIVASPLTGEKLEFRTVSISLRPDRALCLTGPLNGSSGAPGPVEMRIDDAVVEVEASGRRDLHKAFRYLPDPEIRDIERQVTTISGSRNLTVLGSHLDSVAQPRMVVIVASPLTGEKLEFRTPCRADPSGERMRCATPALSGAGALRAPTDRAPLVSHVAFEMDGAPGPRELPLRRPLLSQLLYYPDPEFPPFPDNETLQVREDQTFLTLKGRHLDLVHLPDDIRVLLDGGVTTCNVSSLSGEELVCILPPALRPRNGSSVSVEVRIGARRFPLGSFQLVSGSSSSHATLIGCMFGLGACAGLLFVACFVWRRRKRKPPSYMVAFSAQPQRRSSDYTAAACGAPRRQGSRGNDYHDLRGRILARRQEEAAEGGPCVVGVDEEEEGAVDDETLHLLRAENILIEREQLSLGEVIGQGHFGCVYKGELRQPGSEESVQVAVKTLHNSVSSPAQDVDAFLQEGLMMKDFQHDNVLSLVGVCFFEGERRSPVVVIPYMHNGDLHSYIRDEGNTPTVKDLLNFGVQIAAGMSYLAELKFVHRDLAARNCMLSGEGTVKVADFGLSRDIYERDYYSSDNKKTKLPVKWMAPESLEKGTYTTKTDVWSYGVVLWELMTRGVTPYPDVDNWDILQYLKSGRRMPQPSYCPDLLYEIMLRCWLEDSKDRPTFSELEAEVEGVITKLQKKSQTVGLNVTYVNYPRTEGP